MNFLRRINWPAVALLAYAVVCYFTVLRVAMWIWGIAEKIGN